MLLSNEAQVQWSKNNKQHYISKGYEFTKYNDIFYAKIRDLQPSSNKIVVKVQCDYCGDIVTKTLNNYNRSRKVIKKDCCDNCKHIKTKETNIIKYGVESWVQTDEAKIQIGNANRGYAQEDVELLFKNKDYSLLSTYINIGGKLDFICNEHKEIGIQQTTLHLLQKNVHNCKQCISAHRSNIRRGYTQKEVSQLFKDRGLTLKSTYERYNQDLNYICDKHPEIGIQIVTLGGLFKNERLCLKCSDNVSGMKLTAGYVKDVLKNKGFILLSKEYKNQEQLLEFICEKHQSIGVQTCTLGQIYRGVYVCKGCKDDYLADRDKDKNTQIFNEMTASGLFPILNWENKRIKENGVIKIPYICPTHHESVQYINISKFRLDRGCKYCGLEKNKGSDHYNWKGGVSNLNLYLRGLLRPLIDMKLMEYNYRCILTGKNATLEVHHLYSFSSIVSDALDKLKLPIKEDIGMYSETERNDIESLFMKYHEGNWGIPITPKIHNEFHSKYGNINNTYEQFKEFALQYNINLDEIL